MDQIKKILKWTILLVVTYFLVSFLSYTMIIKTFKKIDDYEILAKRPQVEVLESKASYATGYIEGKIINNVGFDIPYKLIKVDFFDKNKINLGTKYVEIKNLKKDETKNFKLVYKFNNVDSFKINLENSEKYLELTSSEKIIYTLLPVIGTFSIIMLIYYLL